MTESTRRRSETPAGILLLSPRNKREACVPRGRLARGVGWAHSAETLVEGIPDPSAVGLAKRITSVLLRGLSQRERAQQPSLPFSGTRCQLSL